MLFLAGATPFIGDVDSGNTVTDYLDIERERGITVQSAAVSFKWKNSLVNLIDTPGHVDFTLEVESCTRILDGVVTVLDSKAGVQAQTRTVWKQASKFNLPSLFFINKMDKNGADTNHVLKTIEEKLNVKGLLTVYPIYKNGSLYGFLDLLNKKMLRTDTEEWTEIPNTHMDEFFQKREDLFYQVADLDNLFMSHFFDGCSGNCKLIDENYFINALHDIILNRKGALVTCGSALHFPSSVSPLLDQVTRFLPAADLIEKKLATVFGNDFSAFVFKIGHEQRKGQLSYLRLYTGSLHSGSTVYNINREQTEGPLRLFAAHADSLKPVNTVNAGEIAVVSGLKNTLTGDTLVSSKSLSKNLAVGDSTKDQLRACNNSVVFSGIDIPSPVYFCCIEPPSASSIHQFEKALFQISTEDPSVKIRRDKETGQTIIETMGELHLEIIKDKFNREYGLNVFIGELGVSYREMITTSVSHRASVMDEQGESSKTHKASLGMLIEPKSGAGAFKRELPPIRYEWQKAISEGCSNALHNGPILGFPVQDIIITLQELNVSGGKINSAVLSSCAHKCITESLELAEACLTEPLMKIEVDVDDNSCGTQALLQELSKRRSQILHCDQQYGIGEKIIALVPLAEMKGLSSVVRTLTSGLANLHVQIDKYVKVNKHDEQSIISKLRK